MELTESKHKSYEILNLIGYSLSKFNDKFMEEFVIGDVMIGSKLVLCLKSTLQLLPNYN